MNARASTALAASLALAAAASADVLFDNFGPSDAYDYGIGWGIGDDAPDDLGPGFVVPAGSNYTLDSVTAAFRHLWGPNTVTVSVYDTVDGKPANVLETASATDLEHHDGEAGPPIVFNFSGTTVLQAGQTYWVVASTEVGSYIVWNWNSIGDFGTQAQRWPGDDWFVFPSTERGVLRVEGTLSDTPSCPADLTGSGSVGVPDLLALLAAWGSNPGHPADLTGNGNVGVPDLLQLLGQWGPCGE